MGRPKKYVGLFSIMAAIVKPMNKPKRRKTGGRGFSKKDYWPHKRK